MSTYLILYTYPLSFFLSGFAVTDVFQNVPYLAVKNLAEVVERYRAYRLVVLKAIQKTAAYAIGVHQLVG